MSRKGVGLGIAVMLLAGLAVSLAGAPETVTLFVTSEKTNTVNVFQGTLPDLTFVKAIPVGRDPHNLGISPDGRWVAVSDRRSGEVSLLDTSTLMEIVRIPLGRQPHDLAFTSDGRTLYVGHEQESFISVVDVATRTEKLRLRIGRAQHDLSISPDDRELWFTVTNRPYQPGDPRVGVIDLVQGKLVTLIDTGANAHDVTLSPDGRQAWVTNSGFLHIPDNQVTYLDVATRRVLGTIPVGKYPFHAPKRGRDGNDVPADAPEMWFSDHGLNAVVALSLHDLRVTASVPTGTEPFHIAATPAGILVVANNASNTVTIVDGPRRALLGTLRVPARPHGLALLTHKNQTGGRPSRN